jgi:hypothetical protein
MHPGVELLNNRHVDLQLNMGMPLLSKVIAPIYTHSSKTEVLLLLHTSSKTPA